MRTKIIIFALSCLVFAGCTYDNYKGPKSNLTGQIVYDGEPIGVRTNGAQLELWQDGFELREKIPVHIAHDGSYSARLFNGEYKLVRLAGAPWEDQPGDTIIVEVKGNTVKNVEVKPYFIVKDASYQSKSGGEVTAKFTVDKISSSADLAEVCLYFGVNVLTDQNKHEHIARADVSGITSGQATSITTTLPEKLLNKGYLFVRVGVRSNKSNEFCYTQVHKLDL